MTHTEIADALQRLADAIAKAPLTLFPAAQEACRKAAELIRGLVPPPAANSPAPLAPAVVVPAWDVNTQPPPDAGALPLPELIGTFATEALAQAAVDRLPATHTARAHKAALLRLPDGTHYRLANTHPVQVITEEPGTIVCAHCDGRSCWRCDNTGRIGLLPGQNPVAVSSMSAPDRDALERALYDYRRSGADYDKRRAAKHRAITAYDNGTAKAGTAP